MTISYWHGGPPGLAVGDLIEPTTGGAHLIDGCPVCEARRIGSPLAVDDNDPGKVYVTTARWYARIYAAGYPRGWLYRVEPIGDLDPSSDPAPSWAVPAARIVSICERAVTMTSREAHAVMRRAVRESTP